MTTTNYADFGNREKYKLVHLINAELNQGLPKDFDENNVHFMMNKNSGNVFLINDSYQVAVMNGDNLESFYTLFYEGAEGFLEDLIEDYKNHNITHSEDIEELKRICELNNVKLPKRNKK